MASVLVAFRSFLAAFFSFFLLFLFWTRDPFPPLSLTRRISWLKRRSLAALWSRWSEMVAGGGVEGASAAVAETSASAVAGTLGQVT